MSHTKKYRRINFFLRYIVACFYLPFRAICAIDFHRTLLN